ncbi:HAD family hydrolase [Streptomyces albofaciens JCM 4342]|uniref:HAD family hydrolase n=1 Tax=Streptomyces albofaciens TaxID=66866 RepID=UPI00123AFB8D|nr:HAD family hydrolase [Streptomyces albofaciens]KAA6212334.1 HAD family hydrolase [Streptomyces albofaciens JCM 4342]
MTSPDTSGARVSRAPAPLSPATVVFDRDGTLLDFSDMFHRFIVDLHRTQGVVPPSREVILGYEYWQAIISGRLRIGDAVVRDHVDDVVHRYMPHGRLFPGTAEAVRDLGAAGVRMVLVSSWVGATATGKLLERYGLHDVFGAVLTREELAADEAHATDAACKTLLARRALAEVGHRPGDALYMVGDTPADIASARTLGARAIGVRTGNGGRLSSVPGAGPDLLVTGAAEAAAVILREVRAR